MKITVSAQAITTAKADLVAVGVPAGQAGKSELVRRLDRLVAGSLADHIKDESFKGSLGHVLKVPAKGRGVRWVALVGLGKADPATAARVLASRAVRAAKHLGSVAVLAPASDVATVRAVAEGLVTGGYRFDRYLTGDRKPKGGAKSATVIVEGSRDPAMKAAGERGAIVGSAVNLARELVDMPPNDLYPATLAEAARKACAEAGVKCSIWTKKQIEAQRMGLLLAVSRGSGQEPRVVHMSYKPKGAAKRVVFVGKGLTFDSGGLCIKPAKSMGDMKCDMAGAAMTIATVTAAARLGVPVEIHGLIGAVENMSGDFAYRPGDIFTSRDGKTVEIINTDAEGRLVLADVLAYARELEPDYLIDHATLTGACMVALGQWTAGLFANDDELARLYAEAAKRAGESFWRLPLTEDLRETLRSDVADLKHTGESFGGSITAALFLREFVGKCTWAHCDIAGPAYLPSAHGFMPKGGTGFGVSTALEFLESLAPRG